MMSGLTFASVSEMIVKLHVGEIGADSKLNEVSILYVLNVHWMYSKFNDYI